MTPDTEAFVSRDRVRRLSTATRMIADAVNDRSDTGLWGDTIALAQIGAAREIVRRARCVW